MVHVLLDGTLLQGQFTLNTHRHTHTRTQTQTHRLYNGMGVCVCINTCICVHVICSCVYMYMVLSGSSSPVYVGELQNKAPLYIGHSIPRCCLLRPVRLAGRQTWRETPNGAVGPGSRTHTAPESCLYPKGSWGVTESLSLATDLETTVPPPPFFFLPLRQPLDLPSLNSQPLFSWKLRNNPFKLSLDFL